MSIKKTVAIFEKTFKDMMKNKKVLIMFLLFPIMTIFFYNMIPEEKEFFSNIFLPMHLIVIPASLIASIIGEEKEKNTLKVLRMANVKPLEYFIGIGIFVFIASLLSVSLFLIVIKLSLIELIRFYIIVSLATICSMVIGAAVGIISRNQMSASSFVMPISIILGTIPIFSAFNETIKNIADITYTQRLLNVVGSIYNPITSTDYIVMLINFFLFLTLFNLVYRKRKLDDF